MLSSTAAKQTQCGSVWLLDYHLMCRAGGVNDDLFNFKFLPIYLVDSAEPDWIIYQETSSIAGMTFERSSRASW
jgi:hypothetical protein